MQTGVPTFSRDEIYGNSEWIQLWDRDMYIVLDGDPFSRFCREIETMKERYELKLAVERKLAVTLKGENGLMRKRFNGLEKSIDEQKSEIRRLHEAQETLYTTIATHEKDIQAYKEVGGRCLASWVLIDGSRAAQSDPLPAHSFPRCATMKQPSNGRN